MTDLIIGSDHRGYELKEKLSAWLCPHDMESESKFDIAVFQDAGVHKPKRTDYNDVAMKVADNMVICDRGILICGSGFGMAIQANRFKGARAVVCFDVFDVEQARQHNDMNVLCIGADYTDFDTAKYMIEAFFETKFLKGRHTRRVKKLDEDTNTN